MLTTDQIWDRVKQRSPAPRAQQLERLLKFLSNLDNPHAHALTRPWYQQKCDQESARSLEAWIADYLRAGKVSRYEAYEWFRLLYDAIGELNRSGCTIFPTGLAVQTNLTPSPFSAAAMQGAVFAQQWRTGLHNWIIDISAHCECDDDWLAAIALSAVFHGALLDSRKLNLFIEMITKREQPLVEDGITHVRFNLPFQGRGNHQVQRWFVDPISEMLIWRYLHTARNPTTNKLITKIHLFLQKIDIDKRMLPKNIGDLLGCCMTWWSERAAPVDLYCANRTISYHGIHDRSWFRFVNRTYNPQAARLPNKSLVDPIDDVTQEQVDVPQDQADLLLFNFWLQEAMSILENDDLPQIKAAIEDLLSRQEAESASAVYLGWLNAALAGHSASRVGLQLSTIRKRFCAAAPRLLAALGFDNPKDLQTLELEDYYAELCLDEDPLAPLPDIAGGLRDFHSYLVKRYAKPHIHSEEEVFGDANALKPVDSNLINFDDYLKAQAWLDRQVKARQNIPICKIVLALAFKTGARRMEIFGLQMRDIHDIAGLSCLIRKNPGRSLKTDNARRKVDLRALLTPTEQRWVTDWLSNRRLQCPEVDALGGNASYLFKEFGANATESWVNTITARVCEAVRASTGDKQLFIHHLRHSFATWCYMRLRAPDYPDIKNYFINYPATMFALSTGGRLRIQLLWHKPEVTRVYSFVVARLLGHSSPYISFNHYIHATDFILGALALRECRNVRHAVLLCACGLKKTSAYEHLGDSITDLVQSSRNMHGAPRAKSVVVRGGRRSGNRTKSVPSMPAGMLHAKTVQSILKLTLVDRLAEDVIAKILEISQASVVAIVRALGDIETQMSLSGRAKVRLLNFPAKVRDAHAQDFALHVALKLGQLLVSSSSLCKQGIDLHLEHFDVDQFDVVFKDHKDMENLRKYREFLAALDLDSGLFQWIIRDMDASNTSLPEWAQDQVKGWIPQGTKVIRPKSARGAVAYRKWVGILPGDKSGKSMGMTMTKVMLYTRLALMANGLRANGVVG